MLPLAAILAAAITLPAIAQDIKAPAVAALAQKGANIALTSEEAQAWVDKPVYSSDGKKIGEVSGFQRGDDNKVIELRANMGGFLGIGEHHVRVTPAQFRLQGDRVVLELTAEQAKALPTFQK
jgi:hypothetical protein